MNYMRERTGINENNNYNNTNNQIFISAQPITDVKTLISGDCLISLNHFKISQILAGFLCCFIYVIINLFHA